MLGDNGIIKMAETAGNKTGRADFIEKTRLDATAKQVENFRKLTTKYRRFMGRLLFKRKQWSRRDTRGSLFRY